MYILGGLFLALVIHVLFFSKAHFEAIYNNQIMLLDSTGLKLTLEEDLVDDEITDDNPILLTSRPLPVRMNLWTEAYAKKITNFMLDQGQYGSCTANALSYAYMLSKYRENPNSPPILAPSRMFWYALARMHMNASDGYPNAKLTDTGCYASDICWVPENLGVIPESLYPYTSANLNKFPVLTTPPCNEAINNKLPLTAINPLRYSSSILTTANNFMRVIASKKCIILGIYVYSSFMNASTLRTGVVPMPNTLRETLLGGHCICLTGYDAAAQRFSFKNSWGPRAGNKGSFTIPFSYVCNYTMSGDAWSF